MAMRPVFPPNIRAVTSDAWRYFRPVVGSRHDNLPPTLHDHPHTQKKSRFSRLVLERSEGTNFYSPVPQVASPSGAKLRPQSAASSRSGRREGVRPSVETALLGPTRRQRVPKNTSETDSSEIEKKKKSKFNVDLFSVSATRVECARGDGGSNGPRPCRPRTSGPPPRTARRAPAATDRGPA